MVGEALPLTVKTYFGFSQHVEMCAFTGQQEIKLFPFLSECIKQLHVVEICSDAPSWILFETLCSDCELTGRPHPPH